MAAAARTMPAGTRAVLIPARAVPAGAPTAWPPVPAVLPRLAGSGAYTTGTMPAGVVIEAVFAVVETGVGEM